jgi:hypothetical protein
VRGELGEHLSPPTGGRRWDDGVEAAHRHPVQRFSGSAVQRFS